VVVEIVAFALPLELIALPTLSFGFAACTPLTGGTSTDIVHMISRAKARIMGLD
jgi:hypothetical protein